MKIEELRKVDAESTAGPWFQYAGVGWPEGLAEALGIGGAHGVFWPIRTSTGQIVAWVDGRKGTPNEAFARDQSAIVAARNHFAALLDVAEAAEGLMASRSSIDAIAYAKLNSAIARLKETK